MQHLWWGSLAIVLPALCAAAAPDQLPMADDVQADRLLELTLSWGKPLPRAAQLEDLRAMLPAAAAVIETPYALPGITLPPVALSPPLRITGGMVLLQADRQHVHSVRLDVGGACVTRRQIVQRQAAPAHVLPPSGHAPEQALTLSYPAPDRWVSYLFPGLHHACVAQVILKPADASPP